MSVPPYRNSFSSQIWLANMHTLWTLSRRTELQVVSSNQPLPPFPRTCITENCTLYWIPQGRIQGTRDLGQLTPQKGMFPHHQFCCVCEFFFQFLFFEVPKWSAPLSTNRDPSKFLELTRDEENEANDHEKRHCSQDDGRDRRAPRHPVTWGLRLTSGFWFQCPFRFGLLWFGYLSPR